MLSCWIIWSCACLASVLLLVAVCFFLIRKSSTPFLYDRPEELPHAGNVLLLGTNKFASHGGLNRYYQYRIEMAEALYRAGKATLIFVSGGPGRRRGSNEAADMRTSLLEKGVPAGIIQVDTEGTRTWKSVLHYRDRYGCEDLFIISQRFHCERALFIARRTGIPAWGLNARKVTGKTARRIMIREIFARVKCMGEWIFWYIRNSIGNLFHGNGRSHTL